MKNDNLYTLVSYHSVNGGINNLQVVKVVKPTTHAGLLQTLKVFTSKKHKAMERAERFMKINNK